MCLNALISSGLTQSPPFNQQDSGQINMSNPHEWVARSAQGLRKLQTAVLMETLLSYQFDKRYFWRVQNAEGHKTTRYNVWREKRAETTGMVWTLKKKKDCEQHFKDCYTFQIETYKLKKKKQRGWSWLKRKTEHWV